jgi:hypothetical protein
MSNTPTGTLRTGKYVVDITGNGCSIFKIEENESKIFVCGGISDPELAMMLIEGLILVDNKRFYYPDSGPSVAAEPKDSMAQFLKR